MNKFRWNVKLNTKAIKGKYETNNSIHVKALIKKTRFGTLEKGDSITITKMKK